MQAWKRWHNRFQLCRITLQHLEFFASSLQHPCRDVGKHSLRKLHHVVERCKGHLGLNHPKLGQVSARLRLLRPKRRSKTVDLSESCGGSFVVELPGLREISFLAFKIVYFEERCGALASCGSKDWRIGKREPVVIQKIAHCLHHSVANFKNRMLSPGTQPQMPVVHEKLGTVFLGCNRVIMNRRENL